jgi:predicted protein tyrosine phosphatase
VFELVDFMSKRTAQNTFCTKQVGLERSLISVTDPKSSNGRPALLKEGAWGGVLRLEFHDVDRNGPNDKYVLFTDEDAINILKFLKDEEAVRTEAYVHCEAGISRSAAIAMFIAQIYGLHFPQGYSRQNRHVFSTLLKNYGQCGYGEGPIAPDDLPAVEYLKTRGVVPS